VKILDPDHPALEALGMRFLIADRPLDLKRFRLVRDGSVRIYENPSAPDVPARPVSKTPLWLGLVVTLVGCVGACALAARGRREISRQPPRVGDGSTSASGAA
jgi:hypothetical protein